jgi:hypothetical protein
MTKLTPTLTEIFDMVAATREGRIFVSYDPLSETEAKKLQGLVNKALEEENSGDLKFREKLLKARHELSDYFDMPAKVGVRMPAEGEYDRQGRADPLTGGTVIRYVSNSARDKVVSAAQKVLYKALKG